MICAICGKEITNSYNTDHVFPRALYKWLGNDLPGSQYHQLRRLVESADNRMYTHSGCNSRKGDDILDLDKLFLGKDERRRLPILQEKLENAISVYASRKQDILNRQGGRCRGCGAKLSAVGILRRIDPRRRRAWDNVCIVCRKCNARRKDFLPGDH